MLKVEIDVMKQVQLRKVTEFVQRHKCPALIVAPDLVTSASVARTLVRGSHKIIAAVDWPKGAQFMSDKFRGMPTEAVGADGFEILLTPGRKVEIVKEIKFLVAFFRDHFPPAVELRFVLGWFAPDRNEEMFEHMLEAFKQVPTPTLVRTTHLTKLTSADGSVDSQKGIMDKILNIKRVPIKLSGNIGLQVRLACRMAHRFACTIDQAKELQANLSNGVIEQMDNVVHDSEVEE